MDNKVFDFHEIKTFADACEKLGMKEHLLTCSMGGDREAQGQAQALYKLLIIQKAMNNGVWRDRMAGAITLTGCSTSRKKWSA